MKGTEHRVEELTSEKAKAETEAAAGTDAEGGAHLAKVVGLHHWELPQQTLVVVAVHLSLFSIYFCHCLWDGKEKRGRER